MSLVAASGTLETVWAEFATVGYTAGTLNTLSNCIDQVGVKLGRGPLTSTTSPKDSEVAAWITRGKQAIKQTKGFTWGRRLVTADTVSGQFRYGLPPDFGGGYAKLRDITNDATIRIIDSHIFDRLYPSVSDIDNGTPIVATVKNQELWINPPCGGVYKLELDYARTGDDFSATDISWVPEPDRWSLVDYAIAESFESLGQHKRANHYWTKWSQDVKLARRSDGKRKWSKYTAARSVFQG